MRHGRRLALRIAITLQLAVTAMAAVYLSLFARIPQYPDRPRTGVMGSGFVHVLPLVVVPLVLVVLLAANRRQFRVETSPRARRALAAVVGGTWLVLASCYTGVWLAAGGMDRDGGLLGLAAELSRQYLPLPIPGIYSRIFEGRNAAEAFLFATSGIIFWAVALAAVWLVLQRRLHRTDAGAEDRDVARSLIRQGGDSLSWMALWEPNKYWFAPEGRGGVAYQQHGNVALTLAGPFGPAAFREETAAGFIRYCAEHALIPVLLLLHGRAVADAEGPRLPAGGGGPGNQAGGALARVQGQGLAERPYRPEPGGEDRRARGVGPLRGLCACAARPAESRSRRSGPPRSPSRRWASPSAASTSWRTKRCSAASRSTPRARSRASPAGCRCTRTGAS